MSIYSQNPKKCLACDAPLTYDQYKSKNKYCNQSCATTFNNRARACAGWSHPAKKTDEEKVITKKLRIERNKAERSQKQSKSRKPRKITRITPRRISYVHKICPECQNPFTLPLSKSVTKYCSAECRKPHMGGYRSKSQITYKLHYYNGYRFDSGAEVFFARLCDQNNIKWERNQGQFKFPYLDSKGKTRHYYPDFLMTETNSFVEIKGKRFLNETTYLKLKAVDRPIHLVMSHEIKSWVEDNIIVK